MVDCHKESKARSFWNLKPETWNFFLPLLP
jgi:hypothetical protein